MRPSFAKPLSKHDLPVLFPPSLDPAILAIELLRPRAGIGCQPGRFVAMPVQVVAAERQQNLSYAALFVVGMHEEGKDRSVSRIGGRGTQDQDVPLPHSHWPGCDY